jgi:ATP-dependent DNA helicase RecG
LTEALVLSERASLAARIGESHFREFKSALDGPPGFKAARPPKDVAVDIGRTLVAFANADGGELLIGVEDDGSVSGLPYDPAQLEILLAAPHTHVHTDTPLPSFTKAIVDVSGQRVLYFSISKGVQYVYLTSDGRCIRREDRDSVPDTAERIVHSREEDRSRIWDREIEYAAKLSDLDLDLVATVASQVAYGISVEKCLQYFDLAEFTPDGLRLKNAAMVLFAKDIRRWHPRCQVRVVTVSGQARLPAPEYNVVKDDVVDGNVMTLVDSAWDRLTLAMAQQPTFTKTARFEQNYLYPQLACREALLNALVHRDYAIEGRGVEISIYSDRMEIASPGNLLSTVALSDLTELRGVHESRNPTIARVLREVGLVREMGEGVVRIFNVMRSSGLAEPELRNSSDGFTVALFNKSLYDPDVSLWLSSFEAADLTEAQRAVMALGYKGREFSAQDAIDSLGIIDVGQLQDILTPLRHARLIERTKDRMKVRAEARRLGVATRKVKSYRVTPGEESSALATADEEVEATDAHYLFLGNLPLAVSETEVVEFLGEFGEVLSVTLPSGQRGDRNRGFGFAVVESTGATDELISRLDGQDFYGRRLRVGPDRKLRGASG